MSGTELLQRLQKTCLALAEADIGWSARRATKGGLYVRSPDGDATTVPDRDHGRAYANVRTKLARMGVFEAEQQLQARQASGRAAASTPCRPVPQASFVAPTAPAPAPPADPPTVQEHPVTDSAPTLADPRVIKEKPIPFDQIESRVADLVDVPMPMSTKGGPRPYKRILGARMRDGEMCYVCAECRLTYSTPEKVRLHLGLAHPTQATLLRRANRQQALRLEAERKEAERKAADRPAPVAAARGQVTRVSTTASVNKATPAVMPAARTLPPPVAVEPDSITARVDLTEALSDAGVDHYLVVIADLKRRMDHWREAASNSGGQWRESAERLKEQVAQLTENLAAETSRRQAAEAKVARLQDVLVS